MRVINMAHGEMMMLGAYTALAVTDPAYHIGLNLYFAIPASFLVVAFVGYLMEVSLIRFLYGRPLDTLLATWGVGMILQQVVLLRFGANLQPMHLPDGAARRLGRRRPHHPRLPRVHRRRHPALPAGRLPVVLQDLVRPEDPRGGPESADGRRAWGSTPAGSIR